MTQKCLHFSQTKFRYDPALRGAFSFISALSTIPRPPLRVILLKIPIDFPLRFGV